MSESTVSEATATANETTPEATDEPAAVGRLTPAQRRRLLRPLNEKRLKKNPKGFVYIPHELSRAELIKTFGLCGYDLETVNLAQVSFRSNENNSRFWAVFRATVKLTVKDENGNPLAVYTASGAGAATNLPSEGDAIDMAIKSAESEAFKRCVINLGDQYGLSLYDDGALESVGGSLVDNPILRAENERQQGANPAAPTPEPRQDTASESSGDNFEVLKTAIRTVRSLDALAKVAQRMVTAHTRRIITDEQRETLKELGAARRDELANAQARQ